MGARGLGTASVRARCSGVEIVLGWHQAPLRWRALRALALTRAGREIAAERVPIARSKPSPAEKQHPKRLHGVWGRCARPAARAIARDAVLRWAARATAEVVGGVENQGQLIWRRASIEITTVPISLSLLALAWPGYAAASFAWQA
jgi:hypothetical protein